MKQTKTNTHKKKLLEALEKTLGVVTTACKIAELSRFTFYKYYNEDKEFAKKVDDIENIAIDFVESQLHKQIKEGNTTATIFYLKTKAKKRGYVERQEIAQTTELSLKEQISKVKKISFKNTTVNPDDI